MKKENLLKSFSALAVAALFGGSLISCSGDGDSYAPTPKITDANGNPVQVTNAGGLQFTYDESGKLVKMSDGNKTYVLKDNKFAFDVTEGKRTCKVEVFLNSDALVSKIEAVWEYTSEEGSEKEETTLEYSYDSRRLDECTAKGKGSSSYGSSYSGSADVDYKWENDNLVKVTVDTDNTIKEDGKSFDEDVTVVYDYVYGQQANPAKQLPYYMGYEITGTADFGGLFSVLGLFGYGPAYLPTGFVETETDDEGTHSHNRSLSFELNDNGTIKSESRGGSRFVYTYTPTRADDVIAESLMQYLLNMRSFIFKHRK